MTDAQPGPEPSPRSGSGRRGFWRDLGGAVRDVADALVTVAELVGLVVRVLTWPIRMVARVFDAF